MLDVRADVQRLFGVSSLAAALLVVVELFTPTERAFAVGPEALPLWPEGAPYAQGSEESDTPVDRESCRPDFSALCYPAVSLTAPYAHKGSGRNLFGPDVDQEKQESLSNDKHVTTETPANFLFRTAEDKSVDAQNSIAFFLVLRKAGVASEMHIYQNGPHGVGMAPADPAVFGWRDRLLDWMRGSGLLSATARVEVTGTVIVNGEALRWGMIALTPLDSNKPRAWTMVSRSKYSIPASRGTALGENVVEVYDLGSVEPRPTREDFSRIDPTGGLRLNVVAGKNEFDLSLTK